MRGPKPAYPIQLTDDQVLDLRRLIRAHTSAQTHLVRAKIVLTAAEQPTWTTQQIADQVGTSDRMVRKWRRRWSQTHSLDDAPRSGAPRLFPPELRAQVTAMACSLPCDQALPLARWSRAELVRQLTVHPALAVVSAGTIGRWLQQEQIRPWRYRMWQHIHDPSAFLARAGPILQLYAEAGRLLDSGTWLVCVDEKTSIQAREAEQAPRPTTRRHAPPIAALQAARLAPSDRCSECGGRAGAGSVHGAQALCGLPELHHDRCGTTSTAA
jgi:transposase